MMDSPKNSGPVLLTERLQLRPPRESDSTAIFHCYATDPDVTRYVGWPRHRDIDDTRAFVASALEEWQRWPAGPLLIESREDGRLLGATGLDFESGDMASTGYVLAKAAWGRGYAQEALSAVVAMADSLGVQYLYALCHADHAISARLLERCGFTQEALLRDRVSFPNLEEGTPQDVRRYSRMRGGLAA